MFRLLFFYFRTVKVAEVLKQNLTKCVTRTSPKQRRHHQYDVTTLKLTENALSNIIQNMSTNWISRCFKCINNKLCDNTTRHCCVWIQPVYSGVDSCKLHKSEWTVTNVRFTELFPIVICQTSFRYLLVTYVVDFQLRTRCFHLRRHVLHDLVFHRRLPPKHDVISYSDAAFSSVLVCLFVSFLYMILGNSVTPTIQLNCVFVYLYLSQQEIVITLCLQLIVKSNGLAFYCI